MEDMQKEMEMLKSTPYPEDQPGSQGDAVSNNRDAEVEESEEYSRLKQEGNSLFLQQLYLQAIGKYEEATTHANGNEQAAALLHNIGLSHDKMKNYDKALEAYNEAVSKKQPYVKLLKCRAKVLCSLKRFLEALDDMVEVIAQEIKNRYSEATSGAAFDFANNINHGITSLLMEILLGATEQAVKAVMASRENTCPPTNVVENFLRSFYGDPVARIWKGMDPTPEVDEAIAEGKADDLTGYLAAVRDLKLKKYENIVKLCSEEIENPEASELSIVNAHFLRGTMTFLWSISNETVEDFTKVILSPISSHKMKSSAHLKLAMRHTNTRHPFSKYSINAVSDDYEIAEKLWVENPDVYFHGAMLLVDRASPLQALEMLKIGMTLCEPVDSVLLKTFYWTMKITMAQDESATSEALSELRKLEPQFDIPECHEMVAQAIMATGDFQRPLEYNEQFDKAIAFNPSDPTFKIKKLIFRHWMGDNGQPIKPEDALAETDKFIQSEGPSQLAYYHIAQMEIIRGKMDEGFAALEKSIELSGSVYEIEARVAAKLEINFHRRVHERLKQEGLADLAEQIQNLTLKSFP